MEACKEWKSCQIFWKAALMLPVNEAAEACCDQQVEAYYQQRSTKKLPAKQKSISKSGA